MLFRMFVKFSKICELARRRNSICPRNALFAKVRWNKFKVRLPLSVPKIIDQLMEVGLIRDAADLFALKKEDLLNLERFAEKSAQNTVEAIQSKKNVSLDKFIYSLGIEHVGEETAFSLARHFKKFNNLRKSSSENLQNITDVGPIVAKSIHEWFKKNYNH